MSPAGKIAYRSMDVAIIKGLSEGDDEYAERMRERTLPNRKPWWKFWVKRAVCPCKAEVSNTSNEKKL